MEDQLVMFLYRMRHGWPFELMGHLFGVDKGTVSNYEKNMRTIFLESICPLLFFPQSKQLIEKNLPKGFRNDFKDALLIVDALPLRIKSPELFLHNRLSWSVYKHMNCFLVVIGLYYFFINYYSLLFLGL